MRTIAAFCSPLFVYLWTIAAEAHASANSTNKTSGVQELPYSFGGVMDPNSQNLFGLKSFHHTREMVRIEVDVLNTVPNITQKPLFLILTTEQEIYGWTVPKYESDVHEILAETKTFCLTGHKGEAMILFFTSNDRPINYTVNIDEVTDVTLNMSKNYPLDPIPKSDRQVMFFKIPKKSKGVVVHLTSEDDLCAQVELHPWSCEKPYDNSECDAEFTVLQTMTRQATITVLVDDGDERDFMIEIFVPKVGRRCRRTIDEAAERKEQKKTGKKRTEKGRHTDRKFISIRIEPFDTESYLAILWFPLIALGMAAVILVVCVCPPMAGYMQYPAKPHYERAELGPKVEIYAPHAVKGSFLATLVVVAVLYCVPAIQLLIANRYIYRWTGNEDICYYNFKCLRPVGPLAAFNNVYSNLGYVIFGITFIMIVRFHSRRFAWRYREVFYALGVALVLEGVLSAGYHICPGSENFQFDTTFMYITAGLCIYHMYHIRNPDNPGRPHVFFFIIAIFVSYVVISLIATNMVFLIILTVVYALSALTIGTILTKKLYLNNQGAQTNQKVLRGMTALHVIINVGLIAFSCYTLIETHTGFPSILLYLFIGNMFFFLLFYIIIKFLNKESVVAGSICCILISLFTWAASIYFFVIKRVTEWSISPAASRELNHECVFLDFFDFHDVWHMFSGFSIFVSFILLLILDASAPDLGSGNRELHEHSRHGQVSKGEAPLVSLENFSEEAESTLKTA